MRSMPAKKGARRNSGFTLVETLIAITILILAISGPLYTAYRAIVAADNAGERLTALYLAQEGIEYVRMLRDNAYLAAFRTESGTDISLVAWDNFVNGLSDPNSIRHCKEPNYCTLDPVQDSILPLSACPGNSNREQCQSLSITGCEKHGRNLSCTGSNAYTQQSSEESAETSYKRTIQIYSVTVSENEVKIISSVTWTLNGREYAVTITDHLTAWQ